jgi:Zn ribbon nucleic-acid-binding protein
MKIKQIIPLPCCAGRRCPDCGSSDDIIPWGDGLDVS